MFLRALSVLVAFLVLPCLSGFAASNPASWSEFPGGRRRPLGLDNTTPEKAGFTVQAASATGVTFTNELRGDFSLTNAVAHNGAGLAIGDVDGDEWPDLYFCNLQGPNRLYRNLGNWRFEEMPIGEAACAGQSSTAAALVDLDGDGDLDLLVNGIATGTRLFTNDGRGHWTEVADSGLSRKATAMSMALADIDGDGDLDLYCAHYIDVMHLADPTTRFAVTQQDGGKWVVSKVNGESTRLPRWKDRFEVLPGGRVRELPEVHGLYVNDGKGRFRAIESEPGTYLDAAGSPIPPARDWGLSVMFRDLDGDGAPDLYVANDNASPDRAWRNTGKGTFQAFDPWKLRHTSRSSMALDFADIDRDGHDDFIVLDMLARSHGKRMTQLMKDYPDPVASERPEEQPRYNRNTLFLGRADGSFAEAAYFAGVAATDWSWGAVFLDVDLDGFEDLLVANGFSFDVMDQDSHDQLRGRRLTLDQQKRIRQFHPPWPTETLVFRNQRDGTLAPAARDWGFDHSGISYGMAVGDLDRDGDLDVVVNRLNEAAGLYRNDASAGRILVRLKGLGANAAGLGARVTLTGGKVRQSQEMIAGGRYLSSDEPVRTFAADRSGKTPLKLEVRWRSGARSEIGVEADQAYEIAEAAASKPPSTPSPGKANDAATAFFVEHTQRLGHSHVEDGFDDWARQPLLPRRLSRLGPAAGWADLNGDGWEDFLVGAARGGRLSVLFNNAGQGFRRFDSASPASGDLVSVLALTAAPGRTVVIGAEAVAVGDADESGAVVFWPVTGGATPGLGAARRVSTGPISPGPLAAADVDADGDLDLFVGGHHRVARYPEPVASALWTNNHGEWQRHAGLSEPLASVGLVNAATFADLNGDGTPDLVLAVEWGPVRVFMNEGGRFVDRTEAWGLAGWTGGWTSVVAGDFDGDGRPDLAAGNWGRNTAYELHRPGPWRVWFGDFNRDGSVIPVEAWRDGAGEWFPIRNRPWLARSLPDLAQRFPTHEAFAKATLRDLLGDRLAAASFVEATSLDSAVFLQRGSRFERVPLPREAQLSPVFGLSVADADGDGFEDLFVAQNFFGHGGDVSRDDAGRGLWLRGRGDGSFSVLETGIRIDGEQRASALADFDRDGRVDVAVTQTGGATRLFRNQGGRPGLRVILQGTGSNPEAVGGSLRLGYAGGRQGPARLVPRGSGYRSQDGAASVLGLSGTPETLEIRWPGGRKQTLSLKGGIQEIKVGPADETSPTGTAVPARP
jgi:hypothetical protein